MKIYDILQEMFRCEVYSGVLEPKREMLSSIHNGAPCRVVLIK